MSDSINTRTIVVPADSIVKWNDLSADYSTFPPSSIHALIARGFTRIMGNEVSSKITSLNAKRAEPGPNGEAPLGDMNDAERAVATADFQKAFMEALASGTLGVRSANGSPKAPKRSPLEAECEAIALREIAAILKSQKLAMPRGDKTLAFPDGKGGMSHLTRADLVGRRLANPVHGPRIRNAAEAELRKREREAAKLVAQGGDDAAVADLLG